MKKLILAGTFLLSGLLANAKESLPDYQILKTEKDPSLKKNEALYIFSFLDENQKGIMTEIKMSYNGTNKTLKPNETGKVSLKLEPGKHIFKFYHNSKYGEITTDSIAIQPYYRSEMEVYFRRTDVKYSVEKPVIYVYAPKATQVNITLDVKGKLEFTYPEYKEGWNFSASPDGTIQKNGKKYNYLFWDGAIDLQKIKLNAAEGFIVERKDLVSFFESKLLQMGLNSKETEDYITYWCPRMNANEKNLIHFIFNKEYDQIAGLTVQPKPNKVFRVFMVWHAAAAANSVKEQKIESFVREGLTVVEWGGAELK